jgi:formate dehydrogenase major subunit
VLSTKGGANSVAAAAFGLESSFELNGHKAVYLALGDETPSQSLAKKLEKAPFLAVQASYLSPVTARADVVLPVEMWAELEGHFINLEGRVQESHKALIAPEGVRSSLDVLVDLASRLGYTVETSWQAQPGLTMVTVA